MYRMQILFTAGLREQNINVTQLWSGILKFSRSGVYCFGRFGGFASFGRFVFVVLMVPLVPIVSFR